MKTIEPPARSEVAPIDDVGTSRKLVAYSRENKLLPSVYAVMSNDDLLTEILLGLPIASLYMFKCVSKRWFSIITDTKFVKRRREIPKVDSPSGLYLMRMQRGWGPIGFGFVPFDVEVWASIESFPWPVKKLTIMQSCNGLLLCCKNCFERFYVYNPCLEMSKVLPDSIKLFWDPCRDVGGVKMVFDPRKSPHYKIIHAVRIEEDGGSSIQIQIYSSETCSLSVCGDPFPFDVFECFQDGIYWDGAIHWLNTASNQCVHFKLDIEKLSVLRMAPIHATVGGYDELCSPHLFESRGCLLLACGNGFDSPHLNIYEKRNGYSEWSLKYVIILDEAMLPLSKTLEMPIDWRDSSVLSIVLEEKEVDSFMVIKIDKTVVEYKFVSETIRTMCHNKDTGGADGFQFIASFAGV